ncbi:hypothetical protein PBCVCVG1_108R [Paramecium bursaria Chlorella virus CVG-1]|jgi:hypothetical protein|nr:hypothetical protein PBCVCVG1_108R [Paramecium bursaria Chlorella virus CVG-1]
MTSFFDDIVKTTKVALDSNVQLEKDAEVLAKNLERKVKQLIKSCASTGATTATYDMKTFHVDFMSKYSLSDLLYTKITPTYVPVVQRIFFTNYTPLKGFAITEIDTNVFKVCWTHGIVKTEPTPQNIPRSISPGSPWYAPAPQPAPQVIPQDYATTPPITEKEIQDFLMDIFPYLQNNDRIV